jgi:hypothetical protein
MAVARDKDLFQRLLLASVLAAGFLLAWGAVGVWVMTVVMELIGPQRPSPALVITRDGTPVVAEYPGGERVLHDLDGNPVSLDADEGRLVNQVVYLSARPARSEDIDDWTQRIRAFSDGPLPATFWYLISDGRPDGTAYFEGYDSQSKQRVGYIGTAGFRQERLPQEERFPFSGPVFGSGTRVIASPIAVFSGNRLPAFSGGMPAPAGFVSYWDVYILGRDEKLYYIDLRKRTVETPFFDTPLLSGGLVYLPIEVKSGMPFSPVVRIDDAVLILDPHGREQRRFPIPEPLRDRDIALVETASGGAVMYSSRTENGPAGPFEYHVFQLTPDGRSREFKVALPGTAPLAAMRVGMGGVVPSPLVISAFVLTASIFRLFENGQASTFSEAFAQSLSEIWPSLVLAQIVAIGMAILCYRRQARYRATTAEQAIWPLFVLLLGLPGWIGYRFARSWPVLETCPSCGRVVPRDHETCGRCAEPFPRPALKGTEVFA